METQPIFERWVEIVDEVVQEAARASDRVVTLTLETTRAVWRSDERSCAAAPSSNGKIVVVTVDGSAQWTCQLLNDVLVRHDGARIANALLTG